MLGLGAGQGLGEGDEDGAGVLRLLKWSIMVGVLFSALTDVVGSMSLNSLFVSGSILPSAISMAISSSNFLSHLLL
jgi:hypothetical protein